MPSRTRRTQLRTRNMVRPHRVIHNRRSPSTTSRKTNPPTPNRRNPQLPRPLAHQIHTSRKPTPHLRNPQLQQPSPRHLGNHPHTRHLQATSHNQRRVPVLMIASHPHTCILCPQRNRATALQTGHVCHNCTKWIGQLLTDINHYAQQAAASIPPKPGTGTGAPSYGSKPPINLDACDPELAMIELNQGDPSSAVTILEMLEMWERSIREDRHLTAYGIASAQRNTTTKTLPTLTGITTFLTTQTDWATSSEDFNLEEYASHLRRAVNTLRRWDPETTQIGTRIHCPGIIDNTICAATIRITTEGNPIHCHNCGSDWTLGWLIASIGDQADGWADIEAITHLAGVHARTVRRWANKGKVRKQGLLYNIKDITQQIKLEVSI